MSDFSGRLTFAKMLLEDVAPLEVEFFDAYQSATSGTHSRRSVGVGMGFPPEVAGVLGMVAVIVGRTVFDKLGEWALGVAGEVAKKFIVDTSVDRLKKWLAAPQRTGLTGILTPEGRREILVIAERDAHAAQLSPEDIDRLTKSLASRLDS